MQVLFSYLLVTSCCIIDVSLFFFHNFIIFVTGQGVSSTIFALFSRFLSVLCATYSDISRITILNTHFRNLTLGNCVFERVKILNHMKTISASRASSKKSAFLSESQSSKLNPNYSEQIMNCIAFFYKKGKPEYPLRKNRSEQRTREKNQTLNRHTRKEFFFTLFLPRFGVFGLRFLTQLKDIPLDE